MLAKIRDVILILVAAVILMAAFGQGDITLIHGFNGNSPVPIRADLTSRSLVQIPLEHLKIHDEDSFWVADAVTVDDTNTRELLIEVPDTDEEPHFTFVVYGSLDTTVGLYETTTKTTGTVMAEYNRDRNSGNATGVVVTHTPAGAGDGNLMFPAKFGGDTGPAGSGGLRGETRPESEIILKRNTKYLLKVTSNTNGNNITSILSWYDHIDED